MSTQKPGVRHTNKGRRQLDRWDLDSSPYEDSVAAAQVYALLGIAEALGDIALSLRAAADELGGDQL